MCFLMMQRWGGLRLCLYINEEFMKKRKDFFKAPILAVLLLFGGCAATQDQAQQVETVSSPYNYFWVDLMPGGPASFHFTIDLHHWVPAGDTLTALRADSVFIFQNNHLLKAIVPRTERFDSKLLKPNEQYYTVTIGDRMPAGDISTDDSIDVSVKVSTENGDLFRIQLPRQKIDKVY